MNATVSPVPESPDVAVNGAGLDGLNAARQLQKAELSVAVVEAPHSAGRQAAKRIQVAELLEEHQYLIGRRWGSSVPVEVTSAARS